MAVQFLLFILISHLGICISSSFDSSPPNQENHAESDVHGASSSPCYRNYVAESYFRRYDSLVDAKFREFLKHELLSDSERSYPKLLDLDRSLIGEGSHRRLSSSIRFSVPPDFISDPSRVCEVIVVERLPSGVFADPFELEHLLHRGVYKDVSVFGDINLEQPSFRSNRSIVEVHLDIELNEQLAEETMKELKIEVPLHARYPPLEESGYARVVFGIPDLLIRCKMHQVSSAQGCLFTPIVSRVDQELNAVVWSIPAGIKDHAGPVSVLTFTSALLSAILIIIASIQLSRTKPDDERLKQT